MLSFGTQESIKDSTVGLENGLQAFSTAFGTEVSDLK